MTRIADWGTALWASFTAVLAMIFAFIPRLLGFLVILIVGLIVAKLLAKAVTLLLRKIGFDEFSDRIGMAGIERRLGRSIDMPKVLGTIVFWFVFLIFLVPAVNALELTSVSVILTELVSYIPNVFVAVLVLFLGLLIGNFLGDVIQDAVPSGRFGNPELLGNVARYAIIGFACIIALQQLRIAPELFLILFSAIVGALALAFGLAFGLGGRESVQRWLAHNEARLTQSTPTPTTPLAQTEPQTGRSTARQNPYRNIS